MISKDGTTIGYERSGSGPALVLVDGAMCYRAAGPMRPLATVLMEQFTVYTYDRRGRGESTDTQPYAVEREIEDLAAVINEAGGEAYVYGISSGAALSLAAAAAGIGITKLAVYEPPFGAHTKEYSVRLRELLAAGQREDAVAHFMAHVGIPAEVIAGLRSQPSFARLAAIAPTLAYDDEILGDGSVPVHLAISVPVLALAGGASPPRLQQGAAAIPNAEHRVLAGQTHDVSPSALAPVLIEFFNGGWSG